MNRIILIGNGFDLAHGLKTSYRNFIDDFWEKEREKIIEKTNCLYQYEDDFIKIASPWEIAPKLKQFNDNAKGYDWFNEFSAIRGSGVAFRTGDIINFKVEHKNMFLKHISEKNYLKNWVDIEEEYYFALNECLNNKWDGGIERLNQEFSMLQEALEEYLTIQTEKRLDPLNKIRKNIYPEFEIGADKFLSDVLFLSFNYTTIENLYFNQYIERIYPNIEIIHIHGELKNPNNSIIFGYGDEIGDRYKHIVNKNDNRYLKNIKTFKYLENGNYQKILNFIDNQKYEIFIMGHSCGISDRTLLNTLFEHKNCESIKIFFHQKDDGTDDYNDRTMNISRNFNDIALIRRRVVNKKDSLPL